MKFTKIYLSLLAFHQCDASAGAIAAKAAGAVVGKVTDIVVNLNPWAAGAVAVTGVSSVGYKYLGLNSLTKRFNRPFDIGIFLLPIFFGHTVINLL